MGGVAEGEGPMTFDGLGLAVLFVVFVLLAGLAWKEGV